VNTVEANEGVVADYLFLGVTRPALALGVPYAALLVNAFVTLELFLTTRNLLCLLICLPFHGLAWLACLAEPRFFDLLAVWGQVRMRAGRGGDRPWKAHSYGCLRGTTERARTVPAAIVESEGRPESGRR
jgi:type IV secretion system protein VirB3